MFSTTSYQQTPNQVGIESHFEITIHKHPDGFGRPLVFIARGEPKSAACHKESFGKEGAGIRLSLEHFHHEIVTIEGVGGRGGKPTNGAAREPTEGQENCIFFFTKTEENRCQNKKIWRSIILFGDGLE